MTTQPPGTTDRTDRSGEWEIADQDGLTVHAEPDTNTEERGIGIPARNMNARTEAH